MKNIVLVKHSLRKSKKGIRHLHGSKIWLYLWLNIEAMQRRLIF